MVAECLGLIFTNYQINKQFSLIFFRAGLAKKSVGGGRVVEPFSEFLKTLRKPAAQDIRDHLKRYVCSYMCMSVCL